MDHFLRIFSMLEITVVVRFLEYQISGCLYRISWAAFFGIHFVGHRFVCFVITSPLQSAFVVDQNCVAKITLKELIISKYKSRIWTIYLDPIYRLITRYYIN